MIRSSKLNSTLAAPALAENIPANSQWLSGEGAGSWFHIESAGKDYKISRYSPTGKIECSGIFKIVNQMEFDLSVRFQFIHLSHCKSVSIQQQGQLVKMELALSQFDPE